MREIVKCNPRIGLQAAMELGIPCDCIMTNGLVLRFNSERDKKEWQELQAYLKEDRKVQWKMKDWNERGFLLMQKPSKHPYKRSIIIPKRIHDTSTL